MGCYSPPVTSRVELCFARRLAILVACFGLALAGCGGDDRDRLRVAVTTSTRDSGLLDRLMPAFEEQCDCRVDVIAAGTGRALELGRRGDVDVVFVHAREAEQRFMTEGTGVRLEDVMVNSFVIVGPAGDPAGIENMEPVQAFERLAARQAPFVSRGDNSGTHDRERRLWSLAGLSPDWPAYVETGRGQGASLITADQMAAYTLTDSATFARFRDRIELRMLVAGHDLLRNPYSVIVVDARIHAAVRTDLGHRFADFLISERAQSIIGGYTIGDERLFHALRPGEGD